MEKDINIVSKSNELRGKDSLDALSDDNIGPLARALREHINEYYHGKEQTTYENIGQDQSAG